MKLVCDHRSESQFKQLRKFGASTGFEPVASALALQMKTHTLEAGQFIEFINPFFSGENIFFGRFSQLLKLRFTAMVTY